MNETNFPPQSWADFSQLVQNTVSIFFLQECVLAICVVMLALKAPGFAKTRLAWVEEKFAPLATHPIRQILFVGTLAIVVRAALIPWIDPVPVNFDENSIILQAQTMAAGRLVNPAHPLWEHFETYYVNQLPAYASMYFPGRGIPPALGLLIADNAWLGVWISMVALCMASVWMLQAWVSLPFALLGGLLVVARLGILSFWVNSFYGGAFAALGAMLVVGALPRILRKPEWRLGTLMGAGAAMLMITRPYEGALACLPIAAVLLARLVKPSWTAGRLAFGKIALPGLVFIAAGGALLLAHNHATTGDYTKTAYDLQRKTYASAPAFLVSPPVESLKQGPAYFRNYYEIEGASYEKRKSPAKIVKSTLGKIFHTWNFYIGPLLAIPFLAGLWVSRRNYFLMGALGFFAAGYSILTWNFPQYTAPIFPVLLILAMRGLEWLRSGTKMQPSGLFLSRMLPAAVVAALILPVALLPTASELFQKQSPQDVCCTVTYDKLRPQLNRQLKALPGRDLVLVKDTLENPVNYEMVFNDADIDTSEVVWAHSIDNARDARLRNYFADRQVWQFEWVESEPDGFTLTPLTAPPGPQN